MPDRKRAIIDVYQSIVEPQDLWTKRLASKLSPRGPKVADLPNGGQGWSFDDGAVLLPLANFLLVERPADRPVLVTNSYKTMRPGCHDPRERVKDLDADGIDTALLFPLVGQHLQQIEDAELYEACVQAYNDGVGDWCRAGGAGRLKPAAIVPLLGGEKAGAEVRRVAAKGFKAVLFSGWPNGVGPDAADDRFWGAIEETQMVLCFNSGGTPRGRAAAAGAGRQARVLGKAPLEVLINNIASGNGAPQVVGRLALRGVFERFPKLKVCYSGTGASWMPYFLEQVDGMYYHDRFYAGFGSRMLPSEYIKRNTRLSFHLDTNAVRNLDEIGPDYLMWCSLFPLETCDWPNSRLLIDTQLRDVAEAQRRLILVDNAADYFGI